jgi:hypothetical protein
MNEEALQYSYELFKSDGYNGSIDDYKSLIASDKEALSHSHALFSKDGYSGSLEEYTSLISPSTQLTPEMMETGKRDASPAYAMAEGKYAVEKKSPTTSPSPVGESVSGEVEQSSELITEEASQDIEYSGKNPNVVDQETPNFAFTGEKYASEAPMLSVKNGGEEVEGVDYIEHKGVKYKLEERDDLEASKKFKAGLYRIPAMLSRMPLYLAEQVATIVMSDEEAEAFSKLSQEQRDLALSKMYSANKSASPEQILSITEAGEKMRQEAERIESTMKQYDQSITEDLFVSGEFGRGMGRLSSEAIGSVPSMLQTMIPYVGLASIAIGSAAEKSLELQEEGDSLNWKTSTNSIVNGAAEGLLEVVTKRIGGKFFKSLAGTAGDVKLVNFKHFIKEFTKDFGAEGLSETATLFIQKMSDYLLNDDFDAFTNSFTEFVDTFLIGGVATGPLSGGSLGMNKLRQVVDKKKIDKAVADTKYGDIYEVFNDDAAVNNMDNAVVGLTGINSSKPFLEGTVKGKVSRGEITTEEGDRVIKNYKNAIESKRAVEGLDVSDAGKREAMRLINEKKRISEDIQGKDEALSIPKKERITEINTRLEQIARGEVVETVTETEQDNAVQEQSPEGVDVQEPTAESGAVGEGDVRQEPARESDSEAEGQKITVEEEIQPVTDNPALKDVEKRRKAELDSRKYIQHPNFKEEHLVELIKRDKNGTEIGDTKEDVEKRINDKYDAEIASEKPPAEKITVEEEIQPVTEQTLQDLENVPEPVIRGLAVKNLNGETLTEQEQQVYDAQSEAVDQMADDINLANKAEKEGIVVGSAAVEETADRARQRKKNVLFQVNRAKRAISKILPNLEIVVHDTPESFLAAVPMAKGKEQSAGGAFWDGKIHINMKGANTRTVAHEVFHAVILRGYNVNNEADAKKVSELTKKMLAAVLRSGDKKFLNQKLSNGNTIAQEIERFSEGYKDESIRSEEQLAELAGYLAERFTTLDINTKTIIKAWIGRMAETLGINKLIGGEKLYSREMTDKDAIDLLNTIAGKTAKGEVITEAKSLEEIFNKIKSEDAQLEESSGSTARFQKNAAITSIANDYIKSKGLKRSKDLEVKKLNPEYSKAIADVYEAAEHMPLDPAVQAAYKALAEESGEQYAILKKAGYKVELWDGNGEPYANSKEMLKDLYDNKHLYIFSTEQGFGEGEITDKNRAENPMLANSGEVDVNGNRLLLNDMFRFVHDAFGHGELGNGFGPIGEENAWYVHSQMFSPEARKAMTSETRGQNSWVNFGPHIRRKDGSIPKASDKDFVPLSQRPFADQKNFLFPDKYVFDNPNMIEKVDRKAIEENSKAEVDRLISLSKEAEDGATMNLDGSKYEGGGLAVPVGSVNMKQSELSPKAVADFVEKNNNKLSNDSFKLGLYKFPNKNEVSIDLNIVVPSENIDVAVQVGKALGQESLYNLDTGENVKTGETGENPVTLTDQEASDLAVALAKNELPEFMTARFQNNGPINATIDFQSRLGKTFSTSKTFKDQGHMDNYIRFMERKGNKEVGVTTDKGTATSESTAPKKRRFANKAVVSVGNPVTGEAKLEIGRINPIMIDGQEFAKMTSVSIPNDAKFAATEMELYTKAMDLAISEGLGGVIVSKDLFNEAAVDENRFDVKKRGDDVVVAPKKDSVLTARFQANYTNPVTGVTYVYDKNLDAWKKLVEIGRITKDKTVKYLQDMMVMVHAPDAAFSGELQRNGETLIEGKGGLYFPIKFMDQNLVWASTRRAAEKMAQQFNEMAKANGGRAYMVLTSAPYNKVLSSTIAANGVMDLFISKAVDRKVGIKKADVLSAIITAANTKEEVKTEDENGKVSLKIVGLGLGLNKTSNFDDAIAAIREKLGPDNSSFSDRKMFSETLAGEMAKLINSSDTKTANFFFELFNNPQFKGRIPKSTGRYKAAKANIIQGLGYMLAEPSLRPLLDTKLVGSSDKGLTGMAYAILEAEGPFEAVEFDGHESYPIGIKGLGATNIHLLENPVKWTDFIVDPETGKTISGDKERANSIMPASAGISMNPLKVDASKVDVTDSSFSLKFQAPNATAFTIYDVINDLRGKGYTDSSIALSLSRQINPDTQKKFTAKEIKSALDIPIDIENSLPQAFTDVVGGVAQGQKMFTEVMEKLKRSVARSKSPTKAKIRAKVHQLLMEHPDFDKQTPIMKKKLLVAIDTALGTTADKAIQAEISAVKKMLSGVKIGARELKSAQVRLRAMIRKNLPEANYSKAEVNKLVKMVTDATPDTIQQVTSDIVSAINTKKSEKAISAIEKLLKTSFSRVEASRKKGAKVSLAFDEALSKVKAVLADLQNPTITEESFNNKMDDIRSKRDEIMTKSSSLTEQDMADLMAYSFALEYGSSFAMENSDRSKVDALNTSLEMLQEFMQAGRTSLKEQLAIAHEAYLQQFNDAFTDITGIDLTGMTEQEQERARRGFEISAEQRGKKLGVVKNAIFKLADSISNFMSKNEDLTGLMDIISKSAGDMFGGPLQEMVTQRFDDSSIVFKRGKMEMQKLLQSKMREVFGADWHRITTVDNAIPIETGVFIGDTELVMSQNEIYYYYNQAKDPANAPSFEKMWGEDWSSKMTSLEAHMSQDTRAWADWQVNEFYQQAYDRYNEVYRRIYRTNLPWNQFYAGRIYREGAQEQTIDMLQSDRNLQMSVAGGSTKMRQANNQKIQRMSGDQVLGNYIQEMETFRAYQETVRDVGKIFGNKMIKDAITKAYGRDFLNLLQGQLRVIANGRRQEVLRSKILSGGTRAFIFAKLGYNLSLVWKQLTSIPTYANDIGYRRWLAGFGSMIANPKATIAAAKEVYANSIYLQDRYANDFLGVVDVYQNTQASMFPEGTKSEFYMNKALDFVMKTGMMYTKAGDAAAIFIGGLPNYNLYKSEFMKKNPTATDQQAIDHAIKRFEKDTKGTQQSGDIQDRDYWQTQGDIVKGMSLFTTSPRQYWRKSMGGYRQLARKMTGSGVSKGTTWSNLRTIATYRIMMPMLYSWASMGFPPLWDLSDDEEESLMWAGIMGNITALFAVGNIMNGLSNYMQGKPWASNMPQLALFQYAEQFISGLQNIDKAKTEETKDKHKQKLMFDSINMVVPQKQLDNSFGNWYRTATGDQEFDWRKMTGYSDYAAENIGKDSETEEAFERLKKAQDALNKKKGK